MYGVDTEVVEERYAILPTQPEEARRKNKNHRQYIDHDVYKCVARPICSVYGKHLLWIAAKVKHAVHVRRHYEYWNPLAEPAEKPQYSA